MGLIYAHWTTTSVECKHCNGTGQSPFKRWVTTCCSAMVRFQSMTGEAYCSECRQSFPTPLGWAGVGGEET